MTGYAGGRRRGYLGGRRKKKRSYAPKLYQKTRRVKGIPNSPFPIQRLVKMRVACDPTLVEPTGLTYLQPASMRVAANHLFNAYGGDQKPFGFDALQSIYNHWCVCSSRLNVNVMEAGTLNGCQIYLTVTSVVNPGFSTASQQMEVPGTIVRTLTNENVCAMSKYVNIGKYFGKSWQQLSMNQMFTGEGPHDGGTTGTDYPDDGIWFNIGFYSLSTVGLYVSMCMDMWVMWTERKQLIG